MAGRLRLLGSRIHCGRIGLLLRLAPRIALNIALAFRRRRLLLRALGLALLRRLTLGLFHRSACLCIFVVRRCALGDILSVRAATTAMTTTARLARSALPRLPARRLLALSLRIGRSLLLNRLLFTNFRLGRLLGLLGSRLRNLIDLLLTLYGIRATHKATTGTTRARGLLGWLLGIARDLGRLFGLVHNILLLGLKVRTATTLGLLRLSGLLLFHRLLRLGNRLILDNLSIHRILLSHSTTEALLLGAALRITLAASAKAASARLGGKGTHNMLIEQLVCIDMLTRGNFFRSRHLNGIIDGNLFGNLDKLLLGITNLGIDGIERRAAVNAAALDLGHNLCRDKLVAHRLGIALLIHGAENLRQRARLNLERLAAEQVVGNQLGPLGRKRRLSAQTLSQSIDILLVIGIYRLGHGAPFICTHIRPYGTTRAAIHAKHLRERPGITRLYKKGRARVTRTRPFRVIEMEDSIRPID